MHWLSNVHSSPPNEKTVIWLGAASYYLQWLLTFLPLLSLWTPSSQTTLEPISSPSKTWISLEALKLIFFTHSALSLPNFDKPFHLNSHTNNGVAASILGQAFASQRHYIACFSCQLGLPRWLSGKESACQCRRDRLDPWIRKNPWRRNWHPTPVFLPGEFHGQRSLTFHSPWDHKESYTVEQAHAS